MVLWKFETAAAARPPSRADLTDGRSRNSMCLMFVDMIDMYDEEKHTQKSKSSFLECPSRLVFLWWIITVVGATSHPQSPQVWRIYIFRIWNPNLNLYLPYPGVGGVDPNLQPLWTLWGHVAMAKDVSVLKALKKDAAARHKQAARPKPATWPRNEWRWNEVAVKNKGPRVVRGCFC